MIVIENVMRQRRQLRSHTTSGPRVRDSGCELRRPQRYHVAKRADECAGMRVCACIRKWVRASDLAGVHDWVRV